MKKRFEDYQAKAPSPVPMTGDAFAANNETAVYWLTSAGIFVNSRGTTIMVDPNIALRSMDPPVSEVIEPVRDVVPQYVMPPLFARDVERLDAILLTHADPDHLGPKSVMELLPSGAMYHGTVHTAKKLRELGVPDNRIVAHPSNDAFSIGGVTVKMTPAYHPWQQHHPVPGTYVYTLDDCCGFKLYTPDGVIWDPGDTTLLDAHFDNADVDLMFVDMTEGEPYHMGRPEALRLVNTLKHADLVMFHWGTFYSPDFCWFSANPDEVRDHIVDKERFLEPHPGEKIVLRKKTK